MKILGIKVVSSLKIDDFILTHHPTEIDEFFNFSGHIHPGIILRGLGRSRLKLSCFFSKKKSNDFTCFWSFYWIRNYETRIRRYNLWSNKRRNYFN
jgi:metallophosphoesterase superfamily enzyme